MQMQHFIDNAWQAGSTTETIPVVDPSTATTVGSLARGTDCERIIARGMPQDGGLASP